MARAARVALAEAWWDLPDGTAGIARRQARRRAAFWYGEALSELSGVKRKVAETRIAELDTAASGTTGWTTRALALSRLAGARDLKKTAEGFVLPLGRRVTTAEELPVPVRIDAVVKTDARKIRLTYRAGEIILNWEYVIDELRYHDPASGSAHGVPGKGKVEPGKFVSVSWTVDNEEMVLVVDGEERLRVPGTFTGLKGKAGIAAADSTLTVQSFSVSQRTRKR